MKRAVQLLLLALPRPALSQFGDNIVPLVSGESLYRTVNPFTWTWFAISTQDEDPDTNETVYSNVLVELDSMDTFQIGGQDVWASFDVMVVNESLPFSAQTEEPGPVQTGSPACWFDEFCPGGYYARYKEASRVTCSFGYNQTSPGGQVTAMRLVWVGVREAGMAPGTVSYTLRVTKLPRVLKTGMHIMSGVSACVADAPLQGDQQQWCRQYFIVDVGDYDVFEFILTRTGDNLTLADGSSTGEGFVGELLLGSPDRFHEPPPAYNAQRVYFDNRTAGGQVGVFCTLEPHAGVYTVAILGDHTFESGFAKEEWLARPGRGRFNLTVRHAQYASGALQPYDERGGCAHFGQTRNYTVTSAGAEDGNLYARLEGGNASFIRARCSGCEWVEARHPLQAVSASPCDLRNGTSWELQVGMDDYTTATLAGLKPAEFVLTSVLQNASAYSGMRVLPAADGGDGYVCCGAVKSWLLPDVPQRFAPAVQINVTAGHVRSVYIKHESCPDPETDVDGSACRGWARRGRPPGWRAAPHLPAGRRVGRRSLRHAPERRPGSLDACRGLRRAPQAAPRRRRVSPVSSTGAAASARSGGSQCTTPSTAAPSTPSRSARSPSPSSCRGARPSGPPPTRRPSGATATTTSPSTRCPACRPTSRCSSSSSTPGPPRPASSARASTASARRTTTPWATAAPSRASCRPRPAGKAGGPSPRSWPWQRPC